MVTLNSTLHVKCSVQNGDYFLQPKTTAAPAEQSGEIRPGISIGVNLFLFSGNCIIQAKSLYVLQIVSIHPMVIATF